MENIIIIILLGISVILLSNTWKYNYYKLIKSNLLFYRYSIKNPIYKFNTLYDNISFDNTSYDNTSYDNISFDNISYDNTSIPKTLYLCCKDKIKVPIKVINRWIDLNPSYDIIISDNNDCIKFLKENYGKLYVDIFNYIEDGPIKADFWRLCILYKNGGVYSDIDIEPFIPLDNFLEYNISFLVSKCTINNLINPHIIFSVKGHYILKECIKVYISLYENKCKYNYWKWSIVFIMTFILKKYVKNIKYDSINLDLYNNRYQIIKENTSLFHYRTYSSYNNIKLLKSQYDSYDSVNHKF